MVRGIGVVNLVHSDRENFYPMDYRIYAPEADGKTQNDPFREMVLSAKSDKQLKARTLLFDSRYASVDNLKLIVRLNLFFVTTLKDNRLVSLSKAGGYLHLQEIEWTEHRLTYWVAVKLKIQDENAVRWQIEQLHHQLKQLIGSEKCECRKARSQRTHLACCYLAWLALKVNACQLGKTLYAVQHDLFSDYLRTELRNPPIPAFLNA